MRWEKVHGPQQAQHTERRSDDHFLQIREGTWELMANTRCMCPKA